MDMDYNILNISGSVSNSSGQCVVQIVRSIVLMCCDLFRSLPELLDKWYSSLLGEL